MKSTQSFGQTESRDTLYEQSIFHEDLQPKKALDVHYQEPDKPMSKPQAAEIPQYLLPIEQPKSKHEYLQMYKKLLVQMRRE